MNKAMSFRLVCDERARFYAGDFRKTTRKTDMVHLAQLMARVCRSGFLLCDYLSGSKDKGGDVTRAMCVGLVEGDRGKRLVEYVNSLGYMAFGHWGSDTGTDQDAARLYVGMRQDAKKRVIDWTLETSAIVSRERLQAFCDATNLPASMLSSLYVVTIVCSKWGEKMTMTKGVMADLARALDKLEDDELPVMRASRQRYSLDRQGTVGGGVTIEKLILVQH
jgi:hypothetical protein